MICGYRQQASTLALLEHRHIIKETTSLQQIAVRSVTRPDQLLASFTWRPGTGPEPAGVLSVPGQRKDDDTTAAATVPL